MDEAFVIDEAVNPIPRHEARKGAVFVLEHAFAQVAGYPGVEGLRAIGHDVEVIVAAGVHRSFA